MRYEPGDYVCPTDLPRRFLCQVVGAESFECGSGRAQVLKLEPLQGPWPAGTCLIRMASVAVAEPASIDSDRETLQPEPALDGIRVLLVDDDANTREAIAMVLAECGAQVVAVGCGADALQALKNQAPDVLVSDMAMPGMDGRSLLRRIRQLRACRGSIPAIALTAYASPEHRMKALLAGYQIFLPKPFDPTELITLVAKLAGRTLGS